MRLIEFLLIELLNFGVRKILTEQIDEFFIRFGTARPDRIEVCLEHAMNGGTELHRGVGIVGDQS